MSTTHFLNIKLSATFYTVFGYPRSSLPFLLGTLAIMRKASCLPHRMEKFEPAVQIVLEFVLGFSKICIEKLKTGKGE
jgi:hypothetical protein